MTLKFPKELIINGEEWKIQPFRFNVHAINTGAYTPSYRDVTVTGVSPLNLPNAKANGLRNIKLYGKCEQTPNLFDKDKATLNYYINASGEEQYNASWACSDYIEVTVGKPYNLSGVSSYGSSPRTGFYAADKSFVSSRSQSSADFTIPDGVKYMRVSIYKANIDTAVVNQVLSMDNPIPILCNNGEVGSTGYTVVGSPTISNDLVVSGFSNGNYIKTPIINWGSTFTFELPLNIGALGSSNQAYAATTGNQGLNIGITGNGKLVQRVGNGSTWVSGEIAGITTFSANDVIYIKYTYDGTAYTLYSSLDGETWTTESSYASATNVFPSGKTINIGTGRLADSGYWGGSIDLKGFKLTVDGVPVRLTETVSLNDQTAVARDLLSCGDDYVDEQNITTGEITRKVGYYIFDGTENWRKSASQPSSGIRFQANTGLANRAYGANLLGLCTHFNTVASAAIQQDINTFVYSTFNEYIFVIVDSNVFPTVEDWTSYVASLYAQGKPIIITYPLATPTTETVAAQNTLQNVEGLNTLYITQSAIDGLSMEVTYSAGVEVTIEAVQNANVDQQVEVTIGE